MIHKDYRFRAHQRQRVIRKRLHIIRNAWGYRDGEPNGWIALEQPGEDEVEILANGVPVAGGVIIAVAELLALFPQLEAAAARFGPAAPDAGRGRGAAVPALIRSASSGRRYFSSSM